MVASPSDASSRSLKWYISEIVQTVKLMKSVETAYGNMCVREDVLIKAILQEAELYFRGVLGQTEQSELQERLAETVTHLELEFFIHAIKIVTEILHYHEIDRVKMRVELGQIYQWFKEKHNDIKKMKDSDYYEFMS